MVSFEVQKQKLQFEMQNELDKLDSKKSSMSAELYWSELSKIYNSYAYKINQIESAQRQKTALNCSLSNKPDVDRNQKYFQQVSKLRLSKYNEILISLSRIESKFYNKSVCKEDPFYEDKLDPLKVFDRWWNSFIEDYPTIEEITKFLNSISINKYGWIVFDDSSYLLKDTVIQSARRNTNKSPDLRKKLRTPLLSKSSSYAQKKKQRHKIDKLNELEDILRSVISTYGFSERLEDALIIHLKTCCIPKGLTNPNDYSEMLEKFINCAEDESERLHIVNEAIQRNWRVLSNGKF